jgi:hypothetical protein
VAWASWLPGAWAHLSSGGGCRTACVLCAVVRAIVGAPRLGHVGWRGRRALGRLGARSRGWHGAAAGVGRWAALSWA